MKWFWCLFFAFWPTLTVALCLASPGFGWWFPGEAASPLGQRIDDLFYLILIICTIAFIGTQAGLAYVLFRGAYDTEPEAVTKKAWHSHGSHELEVIWSVIPAIVLLFIAFYQMDVWAEYRVKSAFPRDKMETALKRVNQKRTTKDSLALAEVTARQFEWLIRYPGFNEDGTLKPLMKDPQPTDLYAVNDLHLPASAPVMINLRTMDVQHSFFLPELRIKQDAVPGLTIPIWLEANKQQTYQLLCAELCGWGHYKMKARFVAESDEKFIEYLRQLEREQNEDRVDDEPESSDE